jgi:hypothetical protein
MGLEPGLLTAREGALQVVGEELNRLLAAHFLPASQARENSHPIILSVIRSGYPSPYRGRLRSE